MCCLHTIFHVVHYAFATLICSILTDSDGSLPSSIDFKLTYTNSRFSHDVKLMDDKLSDEERHVAGLCRQPFIRHQHNAKLGCYPCNSWSPSFKKRCSTFLFINLGSASIERSICWSVWRWRRWVMDTQCSRWHGSLHTGLNHIEWGGEKRGWNSCSNPSQKQLIT